MPCVSGLAFSDGTPLGSSTHDCGPEGASKDKEAKGKKWSVVRVSGLSRPRVQLTAGGPSFMLVSPISGRSWGPMKFRTGHLSSAGRAQLS